jgi:hypothetical protein
MPTNFRLDRRFVQSGKELLNMFEGLQGCLKTLAAKAEAFARARRRTVREKTARLKALRLAKDTRAQSEEPRVKPAAAP